MRRRHASVRRRLRALAPDGGFTLIEVLVAGLMLAILSAPVAGLLVSSGSILKLDREKTGADQLAQAQIETIRTLPYTQVGLVGGNPSGILSASSSTSLPGSEQVTVARKISWVADPIPTAYVTNADYKKVVVTVTRTSDGKLLSSKTTYVASASAPPFAGTTWDQVKRTVIDAVTNAPLSSASVQLTGGPAPENRTNTTDGAGVVIFPALQSSTNGTPVFTLATTRAGYSVYPDDISPGSPSSVSSVAGTNSIGTIRMYKPVSLTINLHSSSGANYTSGATVSLESSRCGVGTVSIPAGQSSVTITSCDYARNKSVSLVPNVTGQVPAFDKYFATAWSNSGGLWGATTSSGVLVPSNYQGGTYSQSATITFGASSYASTKTVNVTVKKSGVADGNARVQLTGGPAGVYLYGTTSSSGVASFTVPVTSASVSFTASANDMGTVTGSASTSISSTTTSPIALTVNIS